MNPGVLTVHTNSPELYENVEITDAYCDYAKYDQFAGPNIKFGRQDIEDALAARGGIIDEHFEVWGTFSYEGQVCRFDGADDITDVQD